MLIQHPDLASVSVKSAQPPQLPSLMSRRQANVDDHGSCLTLLVLPPHPALICRLASPPPLPIFQTTNHRMATRWTTTVQPTQPFPSSWQVGAPCEVGHWPFACLIVLQLCLHVRQILARSSVTLPILQMNLVGNSARLFSQHDLAHIHTPPSPHPHTNGRQ